MRIESIEATNYLSHRNISIAIPPEARVLFIAGPNGSGKTAMAQALEMALSGTLVRGIGYKKDLSALVTQGERDGNVSVVAVSDGCRGAWKVGLRTATFSGGALDGAAWSLNPESFMDLSPQERRKTLFAVAGLQLKPEAIKAALIDKGHTEPRVTRIIHHLRLGFDAAAKAATEAASEARGMWVALTGEAYGDVKGGSWSARVPGLEIKEPVDVLEANLAAAKLKETEKADALSALRNAATMHKGAEKARKALEALEANKIALAAAQKQKTEIDATITQLQADLQGANTTTQACPCCKKVLMWGADHKLYEYEKHKPKTDPAKAHAALTAAKNEHGEVLKKIHALEALVAEGNGARELLQNLPDRPKDNDIARADGELRAAQSAREFAASDLELGVKGRAAQLEATEKTSRARQLHEDVGAFAVLSEAIHNLPAQYVHEALERANGLCADVSRAFGKKVAFGDDMEPRYGTIPYALASESQQWRIRAAVGYALAMMSGLRVLVLDAFDLVEPADRGAIFKFLTTQEDVQIVLCATLKERPQTLPLTTHLVWLS